MLSRGVLAALATPPQALRVVAAQGATSSTSCVSASFLSSGVVPLSSRSSARWKRDFDLVASVAGFDPRSHPSSCMLAELSTAMMTRPS
jgi:hypothetical protein